MARPEGGTEIVLIAPDERTMAMHAAREMPTIGNMNVTNSKKIHVGPKFVSVNQTIENKEMIKGHILGLELVSTATSRRLRCSVAVFLCWAFLVSSGIAFYLFYLTLNKQQVRLDIGLNETWYLRREEWQALKNYELNFLQLPVKYVLVGHSAANYCKERYACIKSMLAIQEDHLKRGWDDIGPNFLVGGNGLVFEGRGANLIGAMVRSWNKKSVTIMFIGDYRTDKATPLQIEHVNILLKKLVEVGVLTPDFELYGHCQITKLIISPGPNVMKSLRNVTNWISRDEDKCLPG